MTICSDLLAKGYFPKELPPTFVTQLLSDYVTTIGVSNVTASYRHRNWTEPVRHNLARPAGLRRPLSIPHPEHYIALSEIIDRCWINEIEPILNFATLASSRPIHPDNVRAFAMKAKQQAEPRALSRVNARYLLRADIQSFYPSLYTHCIPWALHTKAIAKQRINDHSLAGNKIDKFVRNAQSGQTMGIPIGPDASWVLAELVLSAVERDLAIRLPNLKGHRNFDDIELCFNNLAEAETGNCILQEVLSTYELSLNPKKCSIIELPYPIEDSGISELRNWHFRTNATAQKNDIISYFDRVSEMVSLNRGGHTATFATSRIGYVNIEQDSYKLLESLLLQMLVSEPSCARSVAMTLSMLVSAGHCISVGALSDAAERIITKHAQLGHGSEISWVIWLCIAHMAPISQNAADHLSKMEDSVVALLSLHANSLSLLSGVLDTSFWETFMDADNLNKNMWLLSYEASVKGWLPSLGAVDHIASDPFFVTLRAANVAFYDMSKLSFPAPYPPSAVVGGGDGGGSSGY